MTSTTPESPHGYFRPATDDEIREAVALILLLPSREPEDPDVREALKAMYRNAINDVPAMALREAVLHLNRGALGHGFRPSPPEFRLLVDKVMKPRLDARAAEERQREATEAEDQPVVGGDFPATYADIDNQLDRMARTMTKPKGYDIEEVRGEYYRAVRGIKLKVLVETVDRILDGRIQRKFLTVPRVNEFGQLVRTVSEETEKALHRTARSGGQTYRYRLPKSKVLMERVLKDEMRPMVDNDVLPRASIWIPGPVNDHPERGTAYAPDPEWQKPVPA